MKIPDKVLDSWWFPMVCVFSGAALVAVLSFKFLPNRTYEKSITVEKVLTHDGITMYRFWDGIRYVYFADARGQTSWMEYRQTGKTSVPDPQSVETIK